jgi:hypothetical protein
MEVSDCGDMSDYKPFELGIHLSRRVKTGSEVVAVNRGQLAGIIPKTENNIGYRSTVRKTTVVQVKMRSIMITKKINKEGYMSITGTG